MVITVGRKKRGGGKVEKARRPAHCHQLVLIRLHIWKKQTDGVNE